MHVPEPRYTAFHAYLFDEGADLGWFVEGSDGEFKIAVSILAHKERRSAFGAEAAGHNGR